MTSRDLIEKYFQFFKDKGHIIIPSAPLIPENDPSVLFTTAGMHPLVPYLLGEEHPAGKRLVDNQLCLRTDDIDEVGDAFHHTFFEMLGNWSLGDYWKEDAINWSYEFLTKELGLDPKRIWVSCFEGDADAPKDTESSEIWEKVGIPKERIIFLPKKDNWWGPAGETGPCGPDSEMYYEVVFKPHGSDCHPGDNCGRFVEIWNDVFMQYNKTKDGKFIPLKNKNVDTGMGVDRTTAVLQGLDDDYKVSDLWGDIIEKIEEISGKKYEGNERAFRIIADHIRAATFLLTEDIQIASSDKYGSIVRKLIDRALTESRSLGISTKFLPQLASVVITNYKDRYSILDKRSPEILNAISSVESRVEEILTTPSREAPPEEIANLPNMSDDDIINKMREPYQKLFGGKVEEYIKNIGSDSLSSVYAGSLAFEAKTTEGRPVLSVEIDARDSLSNKFNKEEFYKSFNDYLEQHKKISREAGEKLFKGGLADNSEEVTKFHTTTHLLHASLRKILGEHVSQKGSNITSERLRFDFSHRQKLTDEEMKKVGDLINEQIKNDLPVTFETKSLDEAIKDGALHFFAEKYGDIVKVYSIGDPKGDWFSKEVCGGPHVTHTGEIGRVRIKKQEKIGSGLMRVYLILENE